MPEFVDIGSLYLKYGAKKLDADKIRGHIFECIGIYLKLFGPDRTYPPSDDPSKIEVEVTKSKVFLSALRDIATSSIHLADMPSTASIGHADNAISELIRNKFLCGRRILQVGGNSGWNISRRYKPSTRVFYAHLQRE
jgi:hypothetical protein